MDLKQIDQLLDRYGEAERRIAANLLELEADPTYSLLMASGLTGVTKSRIGPQLSAAPFLWSWLHALSNALDDIRELRNAEGRMTTARRTELGRHLTGPSVLVRTEQAGLASRDLLGTESAPDASVTLDQLVAQMRKRYEPIRDAVAAVEAKWRDLQPRLDAADATLAELESEMQAMGVSNSRVNPLKSLVATIRSDLNTDPLGIGNGMGDDLDRQVAEQVHAVAELHRGSTGFDDDVTRARDLLNELRLVRARTAAAWSEATAKITVNSGLVRVPSSQAIDGPKGLTRRLEAFLEVAEQSAPAPGTPEFRRRRTELDGWIDTAERFLAQLQRAEQANRSGLDRRQALRGLLSSYRAKAQATGRDAEAYFSDLADAAHNELFTSPTDLARAEEIVSEIGNSLRSSG